MRLAHNPKAIYPCHGPTDDSNPRLSILVLVLQITRTSHDFLRPKPNKIAFSKPLAISWLYEPDGDCHLLMVELACCCCCCACLRRSVAVRDAAALLLIWPTTSLLRITKQNQQRTNKKPLVFRARQSRHVRKLSAEQFSRIQ